MRKRRLPDDTDIALVLVSGLSQLHPADIAQWTLFVIDGQGDGFVYSSACCARHAGEIIPGVIGPRLAALPPCRGRDG